jgi:hypothetical protein
MKLCVACGEKIHPKRLEILPDTQKCVNCSNTGKKAGITVMLGEGDHTYTETVIMDHEEFIEYKELEYQIKGPRKDELPHPDDVLDEIEEEVEEEIDNNIIKNFEEEEDANR